MKSRLLVVRLAIQNLSRRRLRGFLLALTVAVGGGSVFSAIVLREAIQVSGVLGLSRMGADLILVPRDTTTNLTSALLTVEPTPHTFPTAIYEQVAGLAEVEAAAPQRYYSVALTPQGHQHLELIQFDPHHDFTVLPWLNGKLERPLQRGDLIVGGRREESVGSTINLFGATFIVYGKLALTGVGPFERCLFVTADTAADLAGAAERTLGQKVMDPSLPVLSGILVRLKLGSTAQQFRFATAQLQDVKVMPGNPLYSSVRHGLSLLLSGAVGLTLLMLLSTTLMIAAMYSGLLAERQRELGLFLAIGLRPRDLRRVILTEAVLTTGFGGICGVVLGTIGVVVLERTLGFYFESLQIPFTLPALPWIVAAGAISVALTSAVGLLGVMVPARLVARREPHELVRGDA
ncbi:FtsX-like permease family protein [soil metagenome]